MAIAFSSGVHATERSLSPEQQSEQFLREQQQQLKLLERERNLRELERSLKAITPILPEPAPAAAERDICFPIEKVEILDSDNLYAFEKQGLTEPYLNQCLSVDDIDRLRIDIDRHYISKGWILSRTYLVPNQNLKSGILQFKVLEGRLDSIKLNDDRLGNRLQVMAAFPGMLDEVVYIRDIEQGLEQINRLASNNATMDIVPVPERPGYGGMNIKNQAEDRFRSYLSYDNLGSDSTGREQAKIIADADNILSLNDHWMLVGARYAGSDDDVKDSSSVNLNLSVPYGYWTIDVGHSRSTYLTTVDDDLGVFHLSGDSVSNKIKLSRILHRDSVSKSGFGVDLTVKENDSYLEDVRLETSSRKLTIFTIDAQHARRTGGGIWSLSAAYARGLDLFGAVEDGPIREDDVPRGQFEKLSVDMSLIQALSMLGDAYSYRGILSAQMSRDPLFGSEQMSIGDSSTVRGFRNSPLAGDSGAFLRNDLQWSSPSNYGLTVSFGVDAGYVVAKNGNIANSGDPEATLVGMALGAHQTYSWSRSQSLTWSLTYAKPLRYPAYVEPDSNALYASLNWKWL
ncbi:MAG: ShlB/FhaC/HecB family hemolysin secretion/activation protein [Candidatus Zixiibacteriota bacterium]